MNNLFWEDPILSNIEYKVLTSTNLHTNYPYVDGQVDKRIGGLSHSSME